MPAADHHALSAQDLECVRNDRVLFTRLSFELQSGEALRIEGPNGSGKTSLVRILCGLASAETGVVRWDGTDIRELDGEFMGRVNYIGHKNGTKALLTPMENLRFGASLAGSRPRQAPEQVLAEFGLAGLEDIPVGGLSSGQQRRVALARLLVGDAVLWILDEPVTSVDDAGRRYLVAILRSHVEQGGMLILVSHDPLDLGSTRMKSIGL